MAVKILEDTSRIQ